MKSRRVAGTVSLPPEIATDYEKIADQEAKNKSQLFRDMFLLYREKTLEREFFDLQRYGAKMWVRHKFCLKNNKRNYKN